MTPLPRALAEVAAILLAVTAVGWGLSAALVPAGRGERAERLAWAVAAGLGLVAGSVALAFALRLRPGWLPFLLLAALTVPLSRLLRVRDRLPDAPREPWSSGSVILLVLAAAGVVVYALGALTEPMWANDYLAIWGLKGKTFFAEERVPERLFLWRSLAFSHPEYPLGLPLLYAGLAFLLGRWEDHATALLFPLLQVATVLLVFGWLRRRGASRPLALGAAALLSSFEPLYRAFTTGMADVPISFGLLLLGTAFSDRLDRTDRGASRRLALASVLCVATKNEGLFFVAAALLLAAVFAFGRRGFAARAAALLALPAAVVVAGHRLIRGSVPLSDFDFGLLARPSELLPRFAESVSTIAAETTPAGWTGVASIALLVAAGRASPAGARLLALAACGFLAYVFLPSLAVAGPAWLVRTAFFRTSAALAPLLAAGVAARLIPVVRPGGSTGSAAGPAASAASRGPRRPSTRAS